LEHWLKPLSGSYQFVIRSSSGFLKKFQNRRKASVMRRVHKKLRTKQPLNADPQVFEKLK